MKDLQSYLLKMEQNIADKLFFLNYINLNDYEYVIDFGCANGKLILNINNIYKNVNFVGYDNNNKMLNECNKTKHLNVTYTSCFKKLFEVSKNQKTLIIFSSVFHEIDIANYFDILNLCKNCFTVVIRDMYFDKKQNQLVNCSGILEKIKNKTLISMFEQIHGKIDNLKNLYHFLLKYTYELNYNSEVLENYFSVDYDKIINFLNENNFEISYDKKFTLEFKKIEIKNNFDYDLNLNTHRCLIINQKN